MKLSLLLVVVCSVDARKSVLRSALLCASSTRCNWQVTYNTGQKTQINDFRRQSNSLSTETLELHELPACGKIINRFEDGTDNFDKENGDKFIEGDMIMSRKLYNAFYGLQEGREGILTELTADSILWPNATVPYVIRNIGNNYPDSKDFRKTILDAIDHWEKFTCLQFVEYDERKIKRMKLQYVYFTRKGNTCASVVGMLRDRSDGQRINLAYGCVLFGTVVHEIGHAIGFLHEHTLSDRDKYMKIIKKNIKADVYKDNFQLQSNLLHTYNFPYDFSSIMQYSMSAFTVNGNNTMVPIDKYLTETVNIGQEEGLSFYDKKHANLMYNCSTKCNPKPNCEHEGYVDKRCKCQCLEGYGGKLCEIRKPTPAPICGGNYTTGQDIYSPNYPNRSTEGVKCIWKFTAPAGRRVRIYFSEFDLEGRSGKACEGDTLDIRGPGFNGEETNCGTELHDKGRITEPGTNATYIMFKAHRSSPFGSPKGFWARVSFV